MEILKYIKEIAIWLLERIDLIKTAKFLLWKIPCIFIETYFMFRGIEITFVKDATRLSSPNELIQSILTIYMVICIFHVIKVAFLYSLNKDTYYWFKGNTFEHWDDLIGKDKRLVMLEKLPYGNYIIQEENDGIRYIYKRIGKVDNFQ